MAQGNEKIRPRNRNPMNLTIDTSRTTLAGINHHDNNSNSLRPPSPVPAPAPAQNRFPLSSPITEEIPSPKDSGTSSSQKSGKPVPKLVNANLDGGAAGGEWKDRDLNANSALSSTEVQRAIYARFLEQSTNSRLEARRNMSTTTTTRGSNAVEDVLKAQNRKSGGIVKRSYQQRPAGLQVLHGFSSDDNDDHDHEDEDEKGHSFLDLSDLKSIAKAREQERARENTRHDDYASSQSSEEPLPSRTSELSLSDRPIMIGLKVPYESTPHAATAGDTVDSASSRTPVTPSIMITPAKENPPWHIDMDMDMSTSPQMLHRPRVASSVYSQPSPRMMHDEDAPPVPAIPALHSGTSLHDNMHQRPVSVGTEFDVDEISTKEKGLSPTEDTNTNTSRKNMKKKLLHRLSVNTSAANRPDSQGWWTYLLSPLLSRSNTVSSRRTGFSPQQQTRSARSPLSAVSSPPQPTTAAEGGGEEESSVHWWDDEKQVVIPTEKSHFSPDTPEDMTRHVPPFAGGGVWDMPFSDNHTTTIVPRTIVEGKSEKTRSVFQTGNAVVPNYELHGSAAEYYQASAHDLYHKEDPYFECVNHVCSMTSAKRRAEIEAEEKELEELAAAAAAENEKRGLAVFIFDPSRNKNDPFIAFVEKGTADVKEVVVDEDAAESEKEGEGDGEKKEVGEDVEKPGLSNARDLLSFDSSDEDEDPKSAEEKGHTASRSLHESPDLVATSRSAASFSPPTSTRYEPSVSVPMQAKESKGVGAPPLPPVSYAREMTLPPAPAPAPAPVPLASAPVIYPREMTPPAPAPVQMPFMPPPQPRAFSPEPVPMPMMPPPQPRAFSPEPVPMPMPPPAPIPAPAPPQEPIPMPMSRSPPVNERAPVAMQSPPMPPPSNDTGRGHGIPSGYQWEPVPIPRAMSPPRPARAPSPPMPQPTAAPVFRSAEIVESTTRPEPEPERDAEPVPIPRSAPSFHRPGPFSAQRSDPQPPAPAPPQQSSHHTIDDPESELPPYSAADQSSRNAPRFQPSFLPTYSSRSQSEQHDQNAVAPAPISPGLQQAMTSRGGIPMSDVNQRGTRDVDYNDANSIFRTDEHRTIINVHNYYNGEHPRDAPEPPRPGMQFVSEADLRAREENEARRQRLEKEDNFAKKVGGLWRGRGCISDKGCFGRSGREGRTRRRWYAAIIAFCMLVIILSISLATTLTRKGDPTPVESEWLNITGFPPIPTGIMTVAGPAPAVERSSCIAPTQAWSCALPPEQQSSQAGGYAADFPNFRIEIRFRNNSVSANNTAINSTATRRMFDRRGTWDASPAVPRLEDQTFLGNTTDNITTPFQGEDTPFYITFLSPFDVSNTTANKFKRDDVSSATGTETGTAAPTSATTATQVSTTGTATGTVVSNTATSAGTGTKTQTGTSTATSTSSSSFNVNSIIPAPDLASDGTAAAATLYPLPIQQPIKLYNRGLPTEHYGFFTYFDKSIFLASNATITGGTTDTDSRDTNGGSAEAEASVRCTWSQTRFLVQIWTQPQNVTHMTLTASSNTTGTSSNTSSTASVTASPKSSSSSSTSSSANNFTSPGSFPYPITITIDRHGGLATQKLAYCYGIDQHTSSSSPNTVTGTYYNLTNPKLQAEQRESGGTIVQPSPDYFVLAGAIAQGVTADQIAPVDGGTGGCMCQWRNWIEIH